MRLRAGRRILDLLDELVQAREIMREQARKDSLTQLSTAPQYWNCLRMSWIALSVIVWIGMCLSVWCSPIWITSSTSMTPTGTWRVTPCCAR